MKKQILACAVLAWLFSGCDSKPPNTPTGPDSDGSGSFSGTINSVPWTATADSVTATRTVSAVDNRVTTVLIGGTDAVLISVTCTTRTLGVAATYEVASGAVTCTVTQGPASWQASSTALNSGGSVTFTTLTTSRAVGNYAFLAVPAANSSATGTKTVSGIFDVRF